MGKTKEIFNFSCILLIYFVSLHYVSGKADTKPIKTEFNEWTVDSTVHDNTDTDDTVEIWKIMRTYLYVREVFIKTSVLSVYLYY